MLKETEEFLLEKYGLSKKIFDLAKEVDIEVEKKVERVR